jgi:hypothetical protein
MAGNPWKVIYILEGVQQAEDPKILNEFGL